MKWFVVVLALLIATTCYADGRVCLEKVTGKLIEYQSGNAPLGTLIKNAVNGGRLASDVEEKYVSDAEWKVIQEDQIVKPAKEAAAVKEAERKVKEDKMKSKLGLSNAEFAELREALK